MHQPRLCSYPDHIRSEPRGNVALCCFRLLGPDRRSIIIPPRPPGNGEYYYTTRQDDSLKAFDVSNCISVWYVLYFAVYINFDCMFLLDVKAHLVVLFVTSLFGVFTVYGNNELQAT